MFKFFFNFTTSNSNNFRMLIYEKIYNIDDLRKIGFKDGFNGEIPITDTSRFSGTYDYIISEGMNAMELIFKRILSEWK